MENELKKELGVKAKKSILDFFKVKPDNHVLLYYDCSALCRDQRNDDVLFVTYNQDSDNGFAVVHLTFSSKKEYKDYPRTYFYKDFDVLKLNKWTLIFRNGKTKQESPATQQKVCRKAG